MKSKMKSGKIAVLTLSLTVLILLAQSSFADAQAAQAEEKVFPPADQVGADVKKVEADRSDNPAPSEVPSYRPEHNYTHGR